MRTPPSSEADDKPLIASAERGGPKKRRRKHGAAGGGSADAPGGVAGRAVQPATTPKHTATPATGSAAGRLITSYFSPQPAGPQPAAAAGAGGATPPAPAAAAADPSTSLLGALFSPLYTIFNGTSAADPTGQADDSTEAASAASGSSVAPEQVAEEAALVSSEPAQAHTQTGDEVPLQDPEEATVDDKQEEDEADYYEEFDPYLFIKSLPPLPADHAENVRAFCLPNSHPTCCYTDSVDSTPPEFSGQIKAILPRKTRNAPDHTLVRGCTLRSRG
eukprot:COSAG03_NODE_902_length_5420_cov_2.668859_5_plen_276_part_00